MVNAGQRKVASIKSFLDSLAMRSTAYVTTRPRYGVLDVVGLLFRELLLMVVVFLLIFALGAAAVFTLKKTYTAQGAVFAGVGQEYVYQPRVGTAERGQAPQGDEVASPSKRQTRSASRVAKENDPSKPARRRAPIDSETARVPLTVARREARAVSRN